MEWWLELCFNLPNEDNRLSTLWRPSTPYPRDRAPSPWIKKPIHRLWYLPTVSQYSPTASQYGTPPESPKPKPSSSRLSPTFIPEDHFPNLDFLPNLDGWDTEDEFHRRLEEQYLELSVDEIRNVEWMKRPIDEQVWELERRQVELDNCYDSFHTHVEHVYFITIYFFYSLFQGHVFYDDFSYMLHPCTCMHFSMLLPCLIHEALLYIN